jgi:hypothetical protein
MLDQFNKSGNDLRAKLYENHKDYLEEIKAKLVDLMSKTLKLTQNFQITEPF